MMILTFIEYLFLLFFTATGSIFPWMTPFAFGIASNLLIMGQHPGVVTIACILGAWSMVMLLWYFDQYCHRFFEKIASDTNGTTGRMFKKLVQFVHKQIDRAETKTSLFFLIIFATRMPVPDILVVRFLKKRVPFRLMSLSAFIGKVIVFTPVIYSRERLLEIIIK